MRTVLYGKEAPSLREEVEKHPQLEVVDSDPEVVVCFGGDGTLLSAELQWPGVPKAPIKNSRRGIRCMPHPPERVIERLAAGTLVRTQYLKLAGTLYTPDQEEPVCTLTAMNEFNVHMGHINLAVRFRLSVDEVPFDDGQEVIGDGFVVSTPFGSTAYFNHITGGVFYTGIGVAFKAAALPTRHLVVPEESEIRIRITRGPGVLAFDNSPDYFDINEGDELFVKQHGKPATLLTWHTMPHPSDEF